VHVEVEANGEFVKQPGVVGGVVSISAAGAKTLQNQGGLSQKLQICSKKRRAVDSARRSLTDGQARARAFER